MEIFRDIEGYEGIYQITSFGRIWSMPRTDMLGHKRNGKYLKGGVTKNGRNRIILYKGEIQKMFFIHVLVAKAFPEICGTWFEGADVHHKNHKVDDNRPENLIVLSKDEHKALHSDSDVTYKRRSVAYKKAWTTRKRRYGWKKPVLQFSKDGEFIKDYPSGKEAAKETKTNYPTLNNCLRGKIKTAGGYVWKYAS